MISRFFFISLCSGLLVSATAVANPARDAPVLVNTIEQLHIEAENYPKSILSFKNGAYVFEVDGVIKLLTENALTEELNKISGQLTEDQEEEAVSPAVREEMFPDVEKRACSHPPCFNTAICYTYTSCHVCLGADPTSQQRGRCI